MAIAHSACAGCISYAKLQRFWKSRWFGLTRHETGDYEKVAFTENGALPFGT